MCPIRETVIEGGFLTDTILGGGPQTEAVEMLGDELLDDEPPPEQATMQVLNKKMAPNNLE